jgi:hypothetical protein
MICVETFYHGEDEKAYRVVNDGLDRFQTKQGSFLKNMAMSFQRFDLNLGNIVHKSYLNCSCSMFHGLSMTFLYCSILVEALWGWST